MPLRDVVYIYYWVRSNEKRGEIMTDKRFEQTEPRELAQLQFRGCLRYRSGRTPAYSVSSAQLPLFKLLASWGGRDR